MKGALRAASAVDLHYESKEDIPSGPLRRDSRFLFRRLAETVTEATTAGQRGRVLDVGCGYGDQLLRLCARGWEVWGLDASGALLHYCRRKLATRGASGVLVHGIAEQLPFREHSFDRVVCRGSLDHFARPGAFLAETARILKPEGQVIIALSNYDSLSCLLGRWLYRTKQALAIPLSRERPYWRVPDDHTFKGNLAVLRSLGTPWLELERCHGVSLLWLFTRWGLLLEALPAQIAWSFLRAADRIAYRLPAVADMIISVWRPRAKSSD